MPRFKISGPIAFGFQSHGLKLSGSKLLGVLSRAAAAVALAAVAVGSVPVLAQEPEKIDLTVLHEIKNQAFQHSQVMDHLFYISDVYGPRINASRTIVRRRSGL